MENQQSSQQNQQDVRPSEALEKFVKQEETEHPPKTIGTGSNNPVPTEESLIIKKDEEE
ncbi:hypothetical protein ACSBL2_09095 [Pedobacter sp. AW31-3R]|uniref:hypothetical protein n=1 Tax=Pedobacter sp. AW31-3R TaxID=3445781 RepID=UPI003F9EE8E1